MEHRPAQAADLGRIMEIVAEAQSFLKQNRVSQWQNGYPGRDIFMKDIEEGNCHVFTVKGRIAGVICLSLGSEPAYDVVYGGNWLSPEPYAVFHRSAVSREYRGKGIASQMLSYMEKIAKEKRFFSMRADTHRDNIAMRSVLEKNSYIHCGTVYLDGPACEIERVCYQKIFED